ncbi:MAG: tRNA 2-thiouridine(34) synthase MnmA [Gemmatimonadota bacterium]|nr:tRNA 2-thiouridine(34) synthase MnmA [Gemmatimonadota bacterium]
MRVLVALSGGVDSAVTALLLAREGRDLVGVTHKNWCYGEDPDGGRSCCSLESIEAARSLASHLSFPHYVVDSEDPFDESVIGPFTRDYLEGRTPNPCVECNQAVRFPALAKQARDLGCGAFATGHYARVDRSGPAPRILRAVDRTRDQSYMLWRVGEQDLEMALFPLGGFAKDEVREVAAQEGLGVANRPDSQEICFVPDGDFGAFLESREGDSGRLSDTLSPGDIVTEAGEVVGTHRGTARYTVGQRRGLGVALGEPVYVLRVDAVQNRLVVGPEAGLFASRAVLRAVRRPTNRGDGRFLVQIRSRHTAAPASVSFPSPGLAVVEFDEPQRAITPGQSAVLYDEDAVAGGGIIAQG